MGNNVYEYLISYMFIIVSREPNFIYISQQHNITHKKKHGHLLQLIVGAGLTCLKINFSQQFMDRRKLRTRGLQYSWQGINLLEGQK